MRMHSLFETSQTSSTLFEMSLVCKFLEEQTLVCCCYLTREAKTAEKKIKGGPGRGLCSHMKKRATMRDLIAEVTDSD